MVDASRRPVGRGPPAGRPTYLSFKAYRTTESPELRAFSVGFAVVTLGALLGGVADQILHVDLGVGVLVDSVLTMVGFLVITYSLYRE